MGNTVGTEVKPPIMEDLLKKTQPQVEERTTFDCFNSILRAWVFSTADDDPIYIDNKPVALQNFTGFNETRCYILLHMYRTNKIQSLDDDKLDELPDPKKPNALDIAITTNNLSPRGQANCFGGFHSVSGVFNTSTTDSKYDIYIWNGINSSQIVKAHCLAKVFELDGALKEGKCLESLAHAESQLIPLSSIFSFDKKSLSSEKWANVLKTNHLFNTINNSNDFIGNTSHNHSKRLDHSLSQCKPTSEPRSKKRTKKTKKVPTNRAKKDLPRIEQSEANPSVPALSFPTDKNPFRSMSLPASKINQLKQQESSSLDFSIDMAQIGGLPAEEVPQESKARKIARYDGICSKITDSLYIGSDTIARDCETLKRCNVTHVLNCAGTICENYHPDQFVYKTLYLYDGTKENVDCLFYNVLDFMDTAISNKGVVYVHCHQGISRSSAMLILYLMWKENMQFITAHEFVKARREVCNPNAGFTCQLLSWWTARANRGDEFRGFIVTRHRKDCPETPALREIGVPDFFDPRGCYVMYNQHVIYSWKGVEADMFLRKHARKFVKLLQRFDDAPENFVKQVQGKETEEFTKYFPALVKPSSVARNPEFDLYFDIPVPVPVEKEKEKLKVSASVKKKRRRSTSTKTLREMDPKHL